MLAGAHQREFHLILNIFYVDGAAGGHAAPESGHHLIGKVRHGFVNTARGSGVAALYGEKRLGDGDRYFAGLEVHDRAVAFDNTQLARGGSGDIATNGVGFREGCGGVGCGAVVVDLCLHVVSGTGASGLIVLSGNLAKPATPVGPSDDCGRPCGGWENVSFWRPSAAPPLRLLTLTLIQAIFWPRYPICWGNCFTQLQDNAALGAMQGRISGFILWIKC